MSREEGRTGLAIKLWIISAVSLPGTEKLESPFEGENDHRSRRHRDP
jgi:hypothetical protein